jgi:predicted amidohydrolase YtcJ
MFDSGAVVSFSSDEWWGGDMLPTYISPYLGMQVGHTRQYPREWWETEDDGIRSPLNERLDLEQLIEGYTRNGAYQLRRENELGSIEVEKLADLVVLDNNLFEVDQHEIWKVKPSAVMMEGDVIQGSLPD